MSRYRNNDAYKAIFDMVSNTGLGQDEAEELAESILELLSSNGYLKKQYSVE